MLSGTDYVILRNNYASIKQGFQDLMNHKGENTREVTTNCNLQLSDGKIAQVKSWNTNDRLDIREWYYEPNGARHPVSAGMCFSRYNSDQLFSPTGVVGLSLLTTVSSMFVF